MEKSAGSAQQKVDPFVTEIIRSGIVATTDEMKTNLMRTAYNAIVYEALDFTVALTDSRGNLVSIGLGLPSFIRGISDTVKSLVRHFGDDIHPGDVLLTNDSYTHGSHLNHVIMALPVFSDGEIVGYSCSEPHWADIGGMQFGTTTDIYSEGLQLPPLKIYDKGVINKELMSIITLNVRNPELAMGDFRGQVACCRTGEKRVLHMVNKYGKGTFSRALGTLMDNAEQFSRTEIEKIPGGTYEAEQFMDDDGVEIGVPIPVKLKITVKGDRMSVDLSGVGRQVRGYYNSGAGVSGVQMGFKSIVCPTWFPVNDGAFRPLDVVLPPGTVVSATRPAAMRWWMTIPMTVADTMWKAMSQAVPEKIAAGHHADLVPAFGAALDPKTKRPINFGGGGGGVGGGLAGGGFGAKHNEDGMSATVCLNDGDTHNNPIEAGEAKSRVALLLRKELRNDSGGPGKFRGGLGVVVEIVHFTDAQMNSYIERSTCPPWGAVGGKPGLANALKMAVAKENVDYDTAWDRKTLSIAVDWEEYPNRDRRSAKIYKFLPVGSRVVTLTGGGGGFGNPLERDPDRVLDDVFNGYVSLESAKSDYGVVIDTGRWKVDEEATKAMRSKA